MEGLDKFRLGLGVFGGVLLLGTVVRLLWARWAASAHRPIRARVISVRREENEDQRVYLHSVHTVYEVPGRGPLTHFHGCDTDGQAILFSRLHKEGSVHKVVVNPADGDKVFLWDELGKTDWTLYYFLFVALVSLGTAVYAVVEYYGD